MPGDDTLAVRALNHWRGIDDMSYVGLRLLTEPLLKHWSGWERTTAWAVSNRATTPRYREVVRFKEMDGDGSITSRQMLAASPSTAIAEARALGALARVPRLASHPSVFSYRWPETRRTGRSFSYYLDLYLERNQRVAESLDGDDSLCVLVADIKDFYPTISVAAVRAEIEARLAEAPGLSADEDRLVRATIDSYLQASTATSTGLALGPGLSHVLANVAMAPVDEVLLDRHGTRYTRYVDDFAIVVPRTKLADETRFLERTLDSHGFKLNPRKTDDVDGRSWSRTAPTARTDAMGPLNSFITRLGVYCSRASANIEKLEQMFAAEGFRLPLVAFRTQTMYRRWQYAFLRRAALHPTLIANLLTDTADTLIDAARAARSLVARGVEAEGWPSSWPDERHPTLRRWRASRLRRILWWGLQLLPPSGLADIARECSGARGVQEIGLVAEAVRSGRVDGVMAMPGMPMSLALTLIRASGATPRADWNQVTVSAATIESALMLVGRARVVCPTPWVDAVPDEGARALILRMQRHAPARRQRPTGDCVDEIDSLLLNAAPGVEQQLIDTRASPDELTALDVSYLPKLS